MWSGFDPELMQRWDIIRGMARRSHQTPTKEWPLLFVREHRMLLVVREWPDGEVTAFVTVEHSERVR